MKHLLAKEKPLQERLPRFALSDSAGIMLESVEKLYCTGFHVKLKNAVYTFAQA